MPENQPACFRILTLHWLEVAAYECRTVIFQNILPEISVQHTQRRHKKLSTTVMEC